MVISGHQWPQWLSIRAHQCASGRIRAYQGSSGLISVHQFSGASTPRANGSGAQPIGSLKGNGNDSADSTNCVGFLKANGHAAVTEIDRDESRSSW